MATAISLLPELSSPALSIYTSLDWNVGGRSDKVAVINGVHNSPSAAIGGINLFLLSLADIVVGKVWVID